MKRLKHFLPWAVILCLLLVLPTAVADNGITVSIDAPTDVKYCENFTAVVDVTEVIRLGGGQFNVTYDPSVIEITDITDGLIDSNAMEVDWGFIPPGEQGKVTVISLVPSAYVLTGINGSGSLAVIHFHANCTAAETSALTLSGGKLFNNLGDEMEGVAWVGDSVDCSIELDVRCTVDPARTNVDEDVDFSCTPSGGVPPYSYTWDFGDGGTSNSQNPTHRYSATGDYTACVTVEDDLDNTEDCCVDVGIIAAVEAPCDVAGGEPARFAASYLRVSPEQVMPNEQVEISINIGNKGGERGSRTVALYINGYLEDSQTVGVGAGSSRTVVFRVTKSEPGTYVVIVEGQEGRFFVLAPQKTTFLGDGGLGTGGIIVIVVVAIAIILAIVFVFRRRE